MTNIDAWNLWHRDLESAQNFINASWYFACSSMLERRIYMTGDSPLDDDSIFSNMLFLFVGPPAAGKSRAMRKSWSAAKEVKNPDGTKFLFKAAENTTPAGFINNLSKSRKEIKIPELKEPYQYFYTVLHAEELGNLMKSGDKDMANVIIQVSDSFAFNKHTITADSFDLENISAGVIACTTPHWIKEGFTDALFSQGYLSRFIILFADGPRFLKDYTGRQREQTEAKAQVVAHLEKLSKLSGRVEFTPAALEYRKINIEHPAENYLKKRINDSKHLEYYYSRKRIHWFKLAIAMHFSESTSMVIDRPVMERAFDQLNEWEKPMHRAFDALARNPLYEFQLKIIERVQAQGKLHKKTLMDMTSKDMSQKELDDVLASIITSGKLKREGDTYLAQ